jgi:hypothetical protein
MRWAYGEKNRQGLGRRKDRKPKPRTYSGGGYHKIPHTRI